MRVRLVAITAAVLAFVATPALAQSVVGTGKVGVNFAKTSLEDDDGQFDTGWKTGLAIGGGVDVPITELFSFSPEALYTMKGGKGGDFGSDEIKLKVDQIQIPLLFKANFAAGETRPFVVAGPAIGFITRAKLVNDDLDLEQDIKDDVETVDFSLVFGAGVQLGRGTVEFRYDYGLRDLDKESGSESSLRTFTILVGFRFGG